MFAFQRINDSGHVTITILLITIRFLKQGFIKNSKWQEKGVMLHDNILKEAPCLNKTKVIGYPMLAREFCILVNGEFSNL